MYSSEIDSIRRRVGVVMLHGKCNMNCLFCITENSLQEMSPNTVCRVLSIMRERGMNNVVFGGGEPLEWRFSLQEVVAYAQNLGFITQIGTNGVNLTLKKIKELRADRFVLPLDSFNEETHNILRQSRVNHFQLINQRLCELIELSIPFTISTVICRFNIGDIERLGEYLCDLWLNGARIHAWHLYRFLPNGRGGRKNEDILRVSFDEYMEITERIKQGSFPFLVYRRPDMQNSKEVDFFWLESGRIKIGSEVWKTRKVNCSEVKCADS